MKTANDKRLDSVIDSVDKQCGRYLALGYSEEFLKKVRAVFDGLERYKPDNFVYIARGLAKRSNYRSVLQLVHELTEGENAFHQLYYGRDRRPPVTMKYKHKCIR